MIKYIKDFFSEKQIPNEQFAIIQNRSTHLIDSEFVINLIKKSPTTEQKNISNILRKIDFQNGNINHFLKHLAEGYIKTNY